jgi:uncharacterized protein
MSDRTIRTVGHGLATRVPDLADVRVGVQLTRPTAVAASTDEAAAMQRVIDALHGAGIADEDLRTAQLTIGPAWEYPPDGTPRLTGYQASNQLRVTVRRVDQVGAVVDLALAAGATTLDGIEFGLDPAVAADAARTALADAVADARARAEVVAAESGLRIAGVLTIEEHDADGPPRPMFARMEMAAADTPVEAGTSAIRAAVRVTFEVQPQGTPI